MFPLLSQPIYKKLFPRLDVQFPVARRLARQGFFIGIHQGLTTEDLDYVSDKIHEFGVVLVMETLYLTRFKFDEDLQNFYNYANEEFFNYRLPYVRLGWYNFKKSDVLCYGVTFTADECSVL